MYLTRYKVPSKSMSTLMWRKVQTSLLGDKENMRGKHISDQSLTDKVRISRNFRQKDYDKMSGDTFVMLRGILNSMDAGQRGIPLCKR